MSLTKTNLIGKIDRDNKNLRFPRIGKPQPIGCFSIDTNFDYKNSEENFSYFQKPTNLPLDLNKGYGNAKQKPENDDDAKVRLHPVLHFILDHREELFENNHIDQRAIKGCDFIGFRGALRVVMATPYENREDWCIHATRFKGNIYICERETHRKKCERQNRSEDLKKFLAYGLKFEQYCMTSSPTDPPVTNVPVDECKQFHCVFRTQFPGMTLLYGAEMDGAMSNDVVFNIKNKEVLEKLRFIELKCSHRPTNERLERNFKKFKLRNWWCQCFLAGIHDVFVGYRNESGFIDEIDHMPVHSFPVLGAEFWNPEQCTNFLVQFLHMVMNKMKGIDCPNTVFEFYFNPRTRVISFRVYHGKTKNTILPDWYVAEIKNA